jgi:hypothetical protein
VIIMPLDLTDEQWRPIDACIFAGRIIEAIRLAREQMSCSGLGPAIEAVQARFSRLAAEQPGRFTVDLDSYWEGFYS